MNRLLVTSGRGPAECRIALEHVLAIMEREASAAGLEIDIARGAVPDGHGAASAVVIVDGAGSDAFARSWLGSVLWVAQSPVRPHHKRKNWFIGVLPVPARTAQAGRLAEADVRFEAMRAGGPGGQHQNKTESAVRARHVPTGLTVVARDGRSQHRNRSIALQRLAELLDMREQLARDGDRMAVQAGHDRLERGRPVRRFRGEGFVPD